MNSILYLLIRSFVIHSLQEDIASYQGQS